MIAPLVVYLSNNWVAHRDITDIPILMFGDPLVVKYLQKLVFSAK